MRVKIRPYRGTSSWEVDIRFEWPDGTEYRERVKSPLTSRTGSERWGLERAARIHAAGREVVEHAVPPKKKEVPTLRDFWEMFLAKHCLAERLKPSTIFGYSQHARLRILPRFGDKALNELTQNDVQEFKAWLTGPEPKGLALAPRTVNSTLTTLGTIFNKAVDWQLLTKTPFDVTRQKVDKTLHFYTFEEFECLVEAAELICMQQRHGDRKFRAVPGAHLCMVLLAGEAGLRAGEMLALEWGDIDFGTSKVTVGRNVWNGQLSTTKSGKGRHIPLAQRLKRELLLLKTEQMRAIAAEPTSTSPIHRELRGFRRVFLTAGSLLPTNNYLPVKMGHLKAWMESVERYAARTMPQAFPDCTGRLHILRHTFCSHLAMRGAPAKAIQELAGHSSLTMTERYMHLAPGHLEAAVGLLDKPTRPKIGEILENSGPLETAPS